MKYIFYANFLNNNIIHFLILFHFRYTIIHTLFIFNSLPGTYSDIVEGKRIQNQS